MNLSLEINGKDPASDSKFIQDGLYHIRFIIMHHCSTVKIHYADSINDDAFQRILCFSPRRITHE